MAPKRSRIKKDLWKPIGLMMCVSTRGDEAYGVRIIYEVEGHVHANDSILCASFLDKGETLRGTEAVPVPILGSTLVINSLGAMIQAARPLFDTLMAAAFEQDKKANRKCKKGWKF
jgi:hypothetical protein